MKINGNNMSPRLNVNDKINLRYFKRMLNEVQDKQRKAYSTANAMGYCKEYKEAEKKWTGFRKSVYNYTKIFNISL